MNRRAGAGRAGRRGLELHRALCSWSRPANARRDRSWWTVATVITTAVVFPGAVAASCCDLRTSGPRPTRRPRAPRLVDDPEPQSLRSRGRRKRLQASLGLLAHRRRRPASLRDFADVERQPIESDLQHWASRRRPRCWALLAKVG